MKKYIIGLVVACLTVGCGDSELASNYKEFQAWISDIDRLRVLCTTAIVEDMVKNIGGDSIHTMTLIQGELDPHTYQLVKGDDEKLHCAQVVFYSGLGLEHGPSLYRTLTENKEAVSLGDYIVAQQPDSLIVLDGYPDPHIWMDISLWGKAIDRVVSVLSEKLPENSLEYQKRGDDLKNKFKNLHTEIQKIMHEIPEEARYIVSSHDAFNYFGRAYLTTDQERAEGQNSWKRRIAAPLGLSTESQLSLSDIQWILEHLKRYNISVLFAESNLSQDALKKIINTGENQGIDIMISQVPLYADALGPKGSSGDTYLKMMQHNATVIQKHLINK